MLYPEVIRRIDDRTIFIRCGNCGMSRMFITSAPPKFRFNMLKPEDKPDESKIERITCSKCGKPFCIRNIWGE